MNGIGLLPPGRGRQRFPFDKGFTYFEDRIDDAVKKIATSETRAYTTDSISTRPKRAYSGDPKLDPRELTMRYFYSSSKAISRALSRRGYRDVEISLKPRRYSQPTIPQLFEQARIVKYLRPAANASTILRRRQRLEALGLSLQRNVRAESPGIEQELTATASANRCKNTHAMTTPLGSPEPSSTKSIQAGSSARQPIVDEPSLTKNSIAGGDVKRDSAIVKKAALAPFIQLITSSGLAAAVAAALLITLQTDQAFSAAISHHDAIQRLSTINPGGLGLAQDNGGLLLSESA